MCLLIIGMVDRHIIKKVALHLLHILSNIRVRAIIQIPLIADYTKLMSSKKKFKASLMLVVLFIYLFEWLHGCTQF